MHSAATKRVIALVDMDCFYCQVEARLNPDLKGKPMAVVQYNQWKGGGIIAVNYEARDRGVSRYMRGDEAKEICPEIVLVSVPTIRGKADLSNYRDAGDEVAKVFSEFSDCVQRASIDEAYIDLTRAVEESIKNEADLKPDDLPNTFIVGYCDLKSKNEDERKNGLVQWLNLVENEKSRECADYQLAIGGKIVERMRDEIFKKTGFHCSAGIAHNKVITIKVDINPFMKKNKQIFQRNMSMHTRTLDEIFRRDFLILAKLTAGLHKPKRQTILPQDNVPELYQTLPIYKVRNLGGKLGDLVAKKFSIKYMSELQQFSLSEMQQKFDEKTSNWLYNIARGIDLEPVTSRLRPESIGCCKNFTGKSALSKRTEVEHWLKELATEISERLYKDLEKNKRRAKLLTVSFSQESSMSRCGPLGSYEIPKLVNDALNLLKKFNGASASEDLWIPPIKYLGLSASKFTEEGSSIEKYLKNSNGFESEKLKFEPCSSKNIQNESNGPSPSEVDSNESRITKPSITKESIKPSFFLNFLNGKKDSFLVHDKNLENENIENSKHVPNIEVNEMSDEEESPWISLTEVFPDINEADAEVVQSLPEELKKKFWEKLNSINGNAEIKEKFESIIENSEINEKKLCPQCGKSIPVSQLSVHLDYHAALKLYSDLNGSPANSANVKSKKTKEIESKRKKKGASTPSKKMKSLTSFFTPIPKQ